MIRALLRQGIVASSIAFGVLFAVGVNITYVPTYHLLGADVTWVVRSAQLGLLGAGLLFGWYLLCAFGILAIGSVHHWVGRRKARSDR